MQISGVTSATCFPALQKIDLSTTDLIIDVSLFRHSDQGVLSTFDSNGQLHLSCCFFNFMLLRQMFEHGKQGGEAIDRFLDYLDHLKYI